MRITVEKSFERAMNKLPPNRKRGAIRALAKFQTEPRLPSLDFRPLAGAVGYFIIDPHGGDRIILRKITHDHYAAVDVGPHDLYRRWNR